MSRITIIDHSNATADQKALTDNEMIADGNGTSEDARAAVAVGLARGLSEHAGEINTAELIEAREAGYTDADSLEVITHVGMNLLTNIIGNASRVEIGFRRARCTAPDRTATLIFGATRSRKRSSQPRSAWALSPHHPSRSLTT